MRVTARVSHGERRPACRPGRCLDRALVARSPLADDGQADARARHIPVISTPPQAVEDVRERFIRDPRPLSATCATATASAVNTRTVTLSPARA